MIERSDIMEEVRTGNVVMVKTNYGIKEGVIVKKNPITLWVKIRTRFGVKVINRKYSQIVQL